MIWSGKFWILEREMEICGLTNILMNLALPELSCTFAIKLLFSLFSSICWLQYLMQLSKGEFSSKKYKTVYQMCFLNFCLNFLLIVSRSNCEPIYRTQKLLRMTSCLIHFYKQNLTCIFLSFRLKLLFSLSYETPCTRTFILF